jgi:hypothetical protein
MNRTLLSLLLSCLALLATGCATRVVYPAIPPAQSDVVGTWLGYSAGKVEFLLLQCGEDGRGYLAVSYLQNHPPALYRVESWKLKDWDLEISTRPLEHGAEPIFLQNISYSQEALRFEFGGVRWKRNAELFREQAFSARASAAKERIDDYLEGKDK